MSRFAVYLHPETCRLSRPLEQVSFVGHSYPHYSAVRLSLERVLTGYRTLPVRLAAYEDYFRVHSKEYLGKLSALAAGDQLDAPPRLGAECAGYEYCLPGYLAGLGGMMEAIDRMKVGDVATAYCFSLGGHHAYSDWGHGYCLLNPQAAAARYAQEQGFSRILIVDWDIHHGDGTQSIFADDSTVYCVSVHSALDLYMGALRVLRAGTTIAGRDAGHRNIPLLDERFDEDVWSRAEMPGSFFRASESLSSIASALESAPWSPDLIMIFSGYDSHQEDCGKGITNWTNADYRRMTEQVLLLARHAGSPVLSVHGGGYNMPITISAAVSHVKTLAGEA